MKNTLLFVFLFLSLRCFNQIKTDNFKHTKICNKKILTKIKTEQNIKYFIASGLDCTDMESSIYIFILNEQGKAYKFWYSYPGDIRDYATNELVFDSHLFIDTNYKNPKLIWLEKDLLLKTQITRILSFSGKEISETIINNKNIYDSLFNIRKIFVKIKCLS